MAPFAVLALAGGVSALDSVDDAHLPSLVLASVAAIAAGVAALWLPLGRRHALLGLVSPLLQLAAVAALGDATGGHASAVEPLAFLPIMWIAVYGSRLQLAVGTVALFALGMAPAIVAGPPTGHAADWRVSGIQAIIAAGIGWTVQSLLDRLSSRTRRLAASGAALRRAYARLRPLVDVAEVAIVTFEASGQIIEWNPGASRLFGWSASEATGRDVLELLVPPERRDQLRGQLTRLAERPDDVTRRLRTELLGADGTRVLVTLELIVATVGRRRLVYGIATDRRSQEAAERAARAHLEDLTELLGIARDLGAPESDRAARERLCEAALRLSGASMVFLYEPSADGRSLDATAQAGRRFPGISVRLRGEPSGAVLTYHTGQPLFVPDLVNDPRVSPRLVALTGMGAGYFLPILRAGRSTGVLVVLWEAPRPDLSARRQSLLGLFASLAAAIIERADLMRRLDELARSDPLTGLPNRRELDEVFERELALARRRGEPLSLAVADLDYFKAYNDRFGHQAGDALLVAVAAAWRSTVRATDTVARFGGEEFVVLMPGAGSQDARAVAERMRLATPPEVTVSIGVATWNGRESAAELLRRADIALFEAKAAGRNRVVFAGEDGPTDLSPGTRLDGRAGAPGPEGHALASSAGPD